MTLRSGMLSWALGTAVMLACACVCYGDVSASARVIVSDNFLTGTGSYPWFGKVSVAYNSLSGSLCGCALVSPRHAVTAGHCFGAGMTSVWVRFEGSSAWHEAEYLFIPSSYSINGRDVATLRFAYDIPSITDFAQIAWDETWWASTSGARVAGYGLNAASRSPDSLVYSDMPRQACVGWGTDVSAGDLCAGELASQTGCAAGQCADTCSGDSGGPLFHDLLSAAYTGASVPSYVTSGDHSIDANGPVVLFGVTSRGDKRCGYGQVPGIYTDLSRHLPFLSYTVNDKPSNRDWPTPSSSLSSGIGGGAISGGGQWASSTSGAARPRRDARMAAIWSACVALFAFQLM